MWTLYIIECRDGKLYTGITENLERRLKEHVHRGSHFTGYNQMTEFKYSEKYSSKLKAEQREAQIKNWSRAKKLALIRGDVIKLKELSKSRD